MYFTGFADEAGADIATQIKAVKELGWNNIESRKLGDKSLDSITDYEFKQLQEKLNEADVKINCYGSAIANWGKQPRSEQDFDDSVNELKNALPRMQLLGTKMLRGMSFAIPQSESFDSPELESIIFSKIRTLVKMCADFDVLYVHENCMNYGGQSWFHTLKLLENIDSDNFKLVFDTGNPVFIWNRVDRPPLHKQNAWEFYSKVKEHIHYVHIKDCVYKCETDKVFPESEFTFAGEGHGDVKKIVTDLLKSGYDGGFSIEPHLGVVFHEDNESENEKIAQGNYDLFVEYGKRFEKMIVEIQQDLD
ncbi:MAG: sugar phosphate isomerase/epimerase [Lentisphaerae bacterium]|nr:sugar phosphate isomerase/epimerase [Lentisphaerota bacterium]MCP4103454.1 sugar phosphate isomerase/epimerase [Lentisphaerota bacterium]